MPRPRRACVLLGPGPASRSKPIGRELRLIAISVLSKLHPSHPACQGKGMDRLETYIDALRVLARTHDSIAPEINVGKSAPLVTVGMPSRKG